MLTAKVLAQVEFPVHVLSENTKILMTNEKNAKFKMLSFLQYQIFSFKCLASLHCVYKVSAWKELNSSNKRYLSNV